jgi:hypothetical protein
VAGDVPLGGGRAGVSGRLAARDGVAALAAPPRPDRGSPGGARALPAGRRDGAGVCRDAGALAPASAGPGPAPSGSLWQRRYLVPFLLTCAVLGLTQTTGINSILQFIVVILRQAGLGAAEAAAQATWVTAVNVVFTIVGLVLVDKIGRKALLKLGTGGIAVALGVGAGVFWRMQSGAMPAGPAHRGAGDGLPDAVHGRVFATGPGVCVWLALSELMPTRIRSLGMGVGPAGQPRHLDGHRGDVPAGGEAATATRSMFAFVGRVHRGLLPRRGVLAAGDEGPHAGGDRGRVFAMNERMPRPSRPGSAATGVARCAARVHDVLDRGGGCPRRCLPRTWTAGRFRRGWGFSLGTPRGKG